MPINLPYPYILLFIPILSVYITYYLVQKSCSSFNRTESNIQSSVFSIVWPIILLLIGVSWYISRSKKKTNFLYSLLIVCLCLYLPLSLCMSVNNLVLLWALRIITLFILIRNYNHKLWTAFWTLIPLLLWLTIVFLSILI